jgi:hypothetical protein
MHPAQDDKKERRGLLAEQFKAFMPRRGFCAYNAIMRIFADYPLAAGL